MKEHCVFCGADIPAGAMYCRECAQIVEDMTVEQRQALRDMLGTVAAYDALAQVWNQVKEYPAAALDCVKSAAAFVVGMLMED
jgi:predicted nucleic acid-binding Zn ribbon protein